jgi:trimeric autotransporter adhesin
MMRSRVWGVFGGLALFVCGAGTVAAQSAADASPEAIRAQTPPQAGVPRLLQFNGTLRDTAARPVAGVSSVTFAIYAEQDGGAALWSETQNVLADSNGHYNVLLGVATANGVPADLFGTGQSRWLGVTIAREPEMARVLLASVPYALKAADADTLGGLPASEYVTTQALAASNARPSTALTTGATTIVSTPQSGGNATTEAAQGSITQAAVTGTGTTNYIPLWNSGSNLVNSILFQNASRIGVGTTTPVVTLDVNGDSIFRGSFQLVPQGTATASTGQLSHSYQWEASTYNSSTKVPVVTAYGFRATPVGNNTSNPTSSLDLYYGPGGGTLTDTGLSINNKGIITFAPGQTLNAASESLAGALNLPDSSAPSVSIINVGGQSFIGNYGSTYNTFVGARAGGAGAETPAASPNAAFGYQALYSLTTGSENTALGSYSLAENTSGSANTALGDNTLSQTTTGVGNIGIGDTTGQTNVSGTDNTIIGLAADVGSANLSYATALGAFATVGASNALALGGTGAHAVNVGIGTPTPQTMLELSSPNSSVGTRTSPSPTITLTNTAGGSEARVALDFNTSAPVYGTSYNPGSRILAVDEGGFTDTIAFQANTSGNPNQGLSTTLAIHSNGNVEVYGDLNVDGTLIKSAGSFKIDDPIDPGEKYLSHSFVESPDMMNIYNGNVVTDEKGFATVEMPEWFEALNGDFRYQLTTVGQFAQAMVAAEIQNGKFTIQTDKPNVKVSWQVTGVRHDAWANAHRIPTEELKPADERGHYMHPELFGATPKK